MGKKSVLSLNKRNLNIIIFLNNEIKNRPVQILHRAVFDFIR